MTEIYKQNQNFVDKIKCKFSRYKGTHRYCYINESIYSCISSIHSYLPIGTSCRKPRGSLSMFKLSQLLYHYYVLAHICWVIYYMQKQSQSTMRTAQFVQLYVELSWVRRCGAVGSASNSQSVVSSSPIKGPRCFHQQETVL